MTQPLVVGRRPPAGAGAALLVRSPIGDAEDEAAQERACRDACARLGLDVAAVLRPGGGELDGAALAQEVPDGVRALVVRDLAVAFGRDRCSLLAQDAYETRIDAFLAAAGPRGVGLVVAEAGAGDRATLGLYG